MEEASGAGENLHWVQTGPLESELRAEDGRVLGSPRWTKRWGSLATGTTTEGAWTLKRVGFLHPKVTIRKEGSETNVATLSMRWLGGGKVDFVGDGECYSFRRTSIRKSEWSLIGEGKRALSIKPAFTRRKVGADVVVTQQNPRLPLLAIVVWYTILLMAYDTEDASSGAIAAVVAATTA